MKAIFELTLAMLIVLATTGSTWAENSVVVESRAIPAGSGAAVGIRVTNSAALCGLVVPLEIRAVTPGSFITSMSMSYGGRLSSNVLAGAIVGVQHGVKDTTCSSGSAGEGYGNVVFDSIGRSRTVSSSPEGALFVRARSNGGDLLPGTDTTPSMWLFVNVTETLGTFEIDTACMIPNNHLTFVVNWPAVQAVTPVFQRGTVTIVPCNCPLQGDYDANEYIDIFDVLGSIYEAFSGGPSPWDETCTAQRGDVNCDGAVDVFDVIYLIAATLSGGPSPCNPCTELPARRSSRGWGGPELTPSKGHSSSVVDPANWH